MSSLYLSSFSAIGKCDLSFLLERMCTYVRYKNLIQTSDAYH